MSDAKKSELDQFSLLFDHHAHRADFRSDLFLAPRADAFDGDLFYRTLFDQ